MHRKQAVRAASNVNSSESTSKPQKESRISSSVSGIPVLPALALFSWTSLLEFVVVFLSSLSILALTAYPSVSGGDAGELVVTSCNLGVAHPPYVQSIHSRTKPIPLRKHSLLVHDSVATRRSRSGAISSSLCCHGAHPPGASICRSPF